jgi:hypothetical protein
MTGKQRMECALRFEQPDRPPHFEVMFELEDLAFGRHSPDPSLWEGMDASTKVSAIRESALYALDHGTPGGGYIFSTSNSLFPGLPLSNYEYMLSVYNEYNLN